MFCAFIKMFCGYVFRYAAIGYLSQDERKRQRTHKKGRSWMSKQRVDTEVDSVRQHGDVNQDSEQQQYSVGEILKQRGVSRRDFLKFCSAMTAAMSLPASSDRHWSG
jgi:hypothetical protein